MSYTTPLDAALAYAQLGFRVLPVYGIRSDGTCACKNANCASPAKHPIGKLVPHGVKDATTDPEKIRRWWTRYPDANVGIATEGLLVVDYDPQNGGDLDDLAVFGELPGTVTARTGGGGLHLIFGRHDPSVPVPSTSGLAGLRGIDVRADGGYIVAPPSLHVGGERYSWLYVPGEYAVVDAPQWLVDLARTRPHPGAAEPQPSVPAGERNSHLYRAGRALHAHGFGEAAILAALEIDNAARSNPPLPDSEVAEIARKASAQPDAVHFRARQSVKRVQPGEDAPTELVITDLSTVEPEEIDWIWAGRLARGKVTIIIGDPGTGKSFFTMDVIARITRGAQWPDGSRAPVGNAVLLNAEDGLADTIRPRIEQQGDPARVRVIEAVREHGTDRTFSINRDLAALNLLLAEAQYDVLSVDPFSAYLGGIRDSYRDSDVRALVTPLARLAERHRIAVVGVMHLNKDEQKKLLYRAGGSIAFVAFARMVFAIGHDANDPSVRLLVPVKSNLTAPPPGLAFSIDARGLTWRSGTVEVDAATALRLGRSERAGGAVERAEDFLREVLSGGPIRHQEIKQLARDLGIGEHALTRAKKRIAVVTVRTGGFEDRGESLWQLPNANPPNSANAANPARAGGKTLAEPTAPTVEERAHERIPNPRKR